MTVARIYPVGPGNVATRDGVIEEQKIDVRELWAGNNEVKRDD